MKYEQARYTNVSTRITAEESERLNRVRGDRSRADVMYEAIQIWLENEEAMQACKH